MTIGERIRDARVAKEWSQEKLAVEASLGSGTVRNIEANGSYNMLSLLAVLGKLDLSLKDIVDCEAPEQRVG